MTKITRALQPLADHAAHLIETIEPMLGEAERNALREMAVATHEVKLVREGNGPWRISIVAGNSGGLRTLLAIESVEATR